MPGRDGTGPLGEGPMTGRGLGYCSGYNAPYFAYPVLGRRFFGHGGFGFGYGRGLGRGYWRRRYLAPYPYYGTQYNPVLDEKTELAEEAKEIENELKLIKDRIAELERQSQNQEK